MPKSCAATNNFGIARAWTEVSKRPTEYGAEPIVSRRLLDQQRQCEHGMGKIKSKGKPKSTRARGRGLEVAHNGYLAAAWNDVSDVSIATPSDIQEFGEGWNESFEDDDSHDMNQDGPEIRLQDKRLHRSFGVEQGEDSENYLRSDSSEAEEGSDETDSGPMEEAGDGESLGSSDESADSGSGSRQRGGAVDPDADGIPGVSSDEESADMSVDSGTASSDESFVPTGSVSDESSGSVSDESDESFVPSDVTSEVSLDSSDFTSDESFAVRESALNETSSSTESLTDSDDHFLAAAQAATPRVVRVNANDDFQHTLAENFASDGTDGTDGTDVGFGTDVGNA